MTTLLCGIECQVTWHESKMHSTLKIILKLHNPLSKKIMWDKLVFLSYNHILDLVEYVNILIKRAMSIEYI